MISPPIDATVDSDIMPALRRKTLVRKRTMTAFKIDYKTSPKARKTTTVIQFHPSATEASELKTVRQYDPSAKLVAVRECTDSEVASMNAGWNPFA